VAAESFIINLPLCRLFYSRLPRPTAENLFPDLGGGFIFYPLDDARIFLK